MTRQMNAHINWQEAGWYAECQVGNHDSQAIVAYRIASTVEYGPDGFYRGSDPSAPYAIWDVDTKALGLGTPFLVTRREDYYSQSHISSRDSKCPT